MPVVAASPEDIAELAGQLSALVERVVAIEARPAPLKGDPGEPGAPGKDGRSIRVFYQPEMPSGMESGDIWIKP